MAKVAVRQIEKMAPVAALPVGTEGAAESRALFHGAKDPIHLHAHSLAPGDAIRIVGDPADRAIHVFAGAVTVDGVLLPKGSTAIAEYGATVELVAGAEGATLLDFHVRERAADDRSGGHVHLLPEDRVPRTYGTNGYAIGTGLHADSACPTCRIWLHENQFPNPDEETAVHSHSEDEIIVVIGGAIRLGGRLYGPGTALAIAADTLYGFSTGPEGLSFINFRGVSPTYDAADGSLHIDEAELWKPILGRPPYVEAPASA